jgi:hypothetical protein
MATTVTKTVKSSGGDYSSLSGFEAALPANITSTDEIWQAACYNFADTTAVTFNGTTTDSTRYIRVYAVERHPGLWSTNAYRLTTTTTNTVNDNYVRFEGIQFSITAAADYRYCLNMVGASSNGDGYLVDGCIFKDTNPGAYSTTAVSITGGSVASNVRNSIAYGMNKSGSDGFFASMGSNQTYFDNCTAYNCDTGFSSSYLDVIARNCLSASSVTSGFSTPKADWNTSCDYNSATDSTNVPGTTVYTSQTFTFVSTSAGSEDLHLQSSDTGALGKGTSLSGTFTNDVDNQTRPTTWDIGADQYIQLSTASPNADTYLGEWADEADGTTNIYTHIDETTASDSDYIKSDEAPSNQAYVCKLSSLTDPVSSVNHRVYVRFRKNPSGGPTTDLTVQLREGYTNESSQGTLIATVATLSGIGGDWTTAYYDLTTTEANNISDYSSLYLRFVANKP